MIRVKLSPDREEYSDASDETERKRDGESSLLEDSRGNMRGEGEKARQLL